MVSIVAVAIVLILPRVCTSLLLGDSMIFQLLADHGIPGLVAFVWQIERRHSGGEFLGRGVASDPVGRSSKVPHYYIPHLNVFRISISSTATENILFRLFPFSSHTIANINFRNLRGSHLFYFADLLRYLSISFSISAFFQSPTLTTLTSSVSCYIIFRGIIAFFMSQVVVTCDSSPKKHAKTPGYRSTNTPLEYQRALETSPCRRAWVST